MARGSPPQRVLSLVDWGFWIHQQRHHVLDLSLGEDAVVAEARHVGAGREGLGVVHLRVSVLLHLGREAAQLAEVVQARPDGAERKLRLAELVAGVAVGARGSGWIVVELLAGSRLRDALALLPVAEVLG